MPPKKSKLYVFVFYFFHNNLSELFQCHEKASKSRHKQPPNFMIKVLFAIFVCKYCVDSIIDELDAKKNSNERKRRNSDTEIK